MEGALILYHQALDTVVFIIVKNKKSMARKKATAEQTEELLTIKEAADLLKVSEISVKRYVSKEIIPSVKIGGARRIIKNDVWDNFIEKIRQKK